MYWMKVNLGEPHWGKITFEVILSFHIRGSGNGGTALCIEMGLSGHIF